MLKLNLDTYKHQISEGNIDIFDDLLKLVSDVKYSDLKNNLIILKANYRQNENGRMRGVLFEEEYRIYRNRITEALLNTIDEIEKSKSDSEYKINIKEVNSNNYILVFGRNTVGKTSLIVSLAKIAEGRIMHDHLDSFRYFPVENEDRLMEVGFYLPFYKKEMNPVKVTIIEMSDKALKETILFKKEAEVKISNNEISPLYLLVTDVESGDKDDFTIAIFIKTLCEYFKNLSFVIIINKWDLLIASKSNWNYRNVYTEKEYLETYMPLTNKMLMSEEISMSRIVNFSSDYNTFKEINIKSQTLLDLILESIS